MEHYRTTQGIVIKKNNHRESDYFITLLTPDLGKISCLAKGVKNIKSSRLGNLQLGNIIKVSLYYKNNFTWLSESQNQEAFLQDHKSLTQLNLLFYILEIVNHFIADNQVIDGIYSIVTEIVQAINHNNFVQLIRNEINFINILGFGLPPEINESYQNEDYKNCQNLIKKYLESIIEKPLQSNKLFK
jgi:DNA repair protein RecO (recombination protein O)